MANTTSKKRRRRKKNRRTLSPAVILLLFLAVLMALLFLLFRVLLKQDAPAPESVETAPIVTETLPPSQLLQECFGEENGYKTYVSGDLTAELGVDVSSHQGYIDWQAVADSGVDFAIIRAGFRGYGDGSTNVDESFQYNLDGALAAGLDVGVYFFSQALTEEEAVAEAAQVISLVNGYDLSYPIYFDWEPIDGDDARTATISGTEVTSCALAFCRTIESAGYQAGIYFNLSNAITLFHLYDLKDYNFWLAEYQDTPSYPFAIQMWQYTNSGAVPGISEQVDLNLRFRPN